MRTLILASAAGLLLGGAALADSPTSTTASNISGDSRGIAPQLPVTAADGSPDQYLMTARSALQRGRTGEAQEALERAETRLLDRSTAPSDAQTADNAPRVAAVHAALAALGRHDRSGAEQAIQAAMAAPAPMPAASSTMPATGANWGGQASTQAPAAQVPMQQVAPQTGPIPVTSANANNGGINSPVASYSGNASTAAIIGASQVPLMGATAPTP